MNDVTLNKKFYLGIARSLLATGQYHGLATRYLSVLRRQKVLKRGATEAKDLATKDNALADIHFTPPLSVAGQLGHKAAIMAEMMLKRGIPIAMELDQRGIHRGTSVGDVIEQLKHKTGQDYNDMEVLNLYQAFMFGHPKLLDKHPMRRYRLIPDLLKALKQERDELECRLHEALVAQDGRIFAVAVDAMALRDVLEQCEDGVVVGFAGIGSKARVNGTEVPTVWGVGKGLAVIAVEDLRSLLGDAAPKAMVGIECDLAGWMGWRNLRDAVDRVPTKRFKFYGSEE